MSSLKLSFNILCVFSWPGETLLRTTQRRTQPIHVSLERIVAARGEVGGCLNGENGRTATSFHALALMKAVNEPGRAPKEEAGSIRQSHVVSRLPLEGLVHRAY